MADPWAEFRTAQSSGADPWAEFRDKPLSVGEKAMDAYKGLGTGTIKGTLALGGALGDLTDLGAKGIEKASNYVADKLGVEPYQRPEKPSALNAIPTTESLTSRLKEALGADFYKPKSDYGKLTERIGEFVPGAATASVTGAPIATMARYAVAPGAATFAAEKVLPETDYKPYLVAGAGLGASLANPSRIVSPLPASPARQAAVNVLEREGVTSLTAGQRTGNQALRYLEDATSSAPMAGHGAARMQDEALGQFTDAALRRAGTTGLATPEVLAANQRRLGQSFDDLSARNTLTPDNRFINDVVNSVSDYRNVVPGSQQRAIVQGYVDDIVNHVNNGQMPGPAYQEMRSRLGKQSKRLAQSDPMLSDTLRDMRNALDGAMRRSIPQGSADAALWDTSRREYAAQKMLETSASRAGEATLEGNISPANLRNTVAADNRGGYARGEGQFNELARAGAHVLAPLPNSGTAQRMNALHLLNAGLAGIPQAIAGRVVMEPHVQRILANQLMTGRMPVNAVAQDLALIEALQRPAIEPK